MGSVLMPAGVFAAVHGYGQPTERSIGSKLKMNGNAAGTPSHSYVTTAAPSLTWASAVSSPSAPTTRRPSAPAVASGLGSRNRNPRPSGIPASASIRPSCPPPSTATSGAGRPPCASGTPHSGISGWLFGVGAAALLAPLLLPGPRRRLQAAFPGALRTGTRGAAPPEQPPTSKTGGGRGI